MRINPTPHSAAVRISAKMLSRYQCIDVILEIDNPADLEGDLIEHEFSLFFTVEDAEPDVGVMSPYLDDWFYAEADGGVLPEPFWNEIEKIGAIDAERKALSPSMDKWHESQIEQAMQGDY